MLVTYAVLLILEDVIKLVWGVNPYFVVQPYGLLGNFDVGRPALPDLRPMLVVVAIVVGVALDVGAARARGRASCCSPSSTIAR